MKSSLTIVKIVLTVASIVSIGTALGATVYFGVLKNNPPVVVQPTPIITSAPELTITPAQLLGSNIDTSRWNDYKNEKYGFEVKHPQDWIVEEENQRPNNSIAGIQFGEKKEIINTEEQKEEVKKIGFSMYVFKSVKDLPQNTENLSLEKWIKKYYEPLREGENIKSVIFGAENYQGLFVEKFKDVGVVAIIPKVYVQKDGSIYNIQGEVPTLATSKDFFATDYDYDKVFQQMLFTFKFIGKDDISTWATYRNDKYKYELKYPPKFIILNEETNKDVVHWRESKELEGGLDIFVEKTKYNSINEIEKSIDDANEAAKKEFGLERYVKLQYITVNNIKGIIVSDRNTIGDWNIVSVFAHDGNLFKVGFVNSIENLKQILSTFIFIEK